MRKLVLILLLGTLAFGGFYFWQKYKGIYFATAPTKQNIVDLVQTALESPKPGENTTSFPLTIPDGYSLSIFAKDLGNPRDLAMDASGNIFVSIPSQGRVVGIFNGAAETIVDGLNRPHGIVFNGTKLFVAETDGVTAFDYNDNIYKAFNGRQIVELPAGGNHFTRSIIIKDNKLYTSTGSSCNVCKEGDDRRAAIWVSNLDGIDFKPFATGLRNAVFMALNPKTNEIWATEMGRDNLGDDIPPDEINIIKADQFYGWPYCWGDSNADKDLNKDGTVYDCAKSVNPIYKLQAHSAPLGLTFLGEDLLVAFHGSWNRTEPTGYKVVKFHNGLQEDFVTGWLKGKEVLGRPVDILVKGSDIYISDDKSGVIYLLKKM
jgi:glucose/arabinose dehydrogenase